MATDLARTRNPPVPGADRPVFQFAPFEAEIRCPACGHTISLWVQPTHLSGRTLCPSCTRPLTGIIHRKLTEHLASGK